MSHRQWVEKLYKKFDAIAFPADENSQKSWVITCKCANEICIMLKLPVLCSKHFDKNSYERNVRFGGKKKQTGK